MMEETEFLAMYTITGEKYTSLCFLFFALETAVDYTLFIAFKNYKTLMSFQL